MKKNVMVGLVTGILAVFFGAWYLYGCCCSLEKELDQYVKACVKQGTFSGSVLVAKNGKVVLCKGYGMADYEHDVPNTSQTIFRLGSITKQFTAMAIMQLQEQRLLNVTDTVSKYIPDYPNGDKITIRHLLTHTAGIPDYYDFPDYKKIKLEPHTPEQMVAEFKNKPLNFKPGEKYSYSNCGYVLLGYLIEKITGKKYETVLKENIFDPLGMKNTGYAHNSTVLKNRASGYEVGEDGELVNARYIDMSVPFSAGGLYSTVEDMYLWDRALYTEKLVTKKSWDEMVTPNQGDYGYGWRIYGKPDHLYISHGGKIDGFKTEIFRFTNDDVCIVVLSNILLFPSHVNAMSKGLAAIVFGEKYELPKKHVAIKLDPVIYDQYVGKGPRINKLFL